MADDASALENLERLGWEALSGHEGATFYEEVMADDGRMVFPGIVMDKRAALAAIRGAPPWSRFELAEVQVSLVGSDTGLVTYRARAERGGHAYEATMSSVYIRINEIWRLVLHQQSPG